MCQTFHRPLTRRELLAGANQEEDSLYNRWLEKEYYHDPRTGENFWVSPSHDLELHGPEGEGYYVRNGNDEVKLVPGFSQ